MIPGENQNIRSLEKRRVWTPFPPQWKSSQNICKITIGQTKCKITCCNIWNLSSDTHFVQNEDLAGDMRGRMSSNSLLRSTVSLCTLWCYSPCSLQDSTRMPIWSTSDMRNESRFPDSPKVDEWKSPRSLHGPNAWLETIKRSCWRWTCTLLIEIPKLLHGWSQPGMEWCMCQLGAKISSKRWLSFVPFIF